MVPPVRRSGAVRPDAAAAGINGMGSLWRLPASPAVRQMASCRYPRTCRERVFHNLTGGGGVTLEDGTVDRENRSCLGRGYGQESLESLCTSPVCRRAGDGVLERLQAGNVVEELWIPCPRHTWSLLAAGDLPPLRRARLNAVDGKTGAHRLGDAGAGWFGLSRLALTRTTLRFPGPGNERPARSGLPELRDSPPSPIGCSPCANPGYLADYADRRGSAGTGTGGSGGIAAQDGRPGSRLS